MSDRKALMAELEKRIDWDSLGEHEAGFILITFDRVGVSVYGSGSENPLHVIAQMRRVIAAEETLLA